MRILISCGEASGDLYAGALATELRRQAPGVEIVGFGGDRLAAAGGRLLGHYEHFSVTGLTEAVRVIPRSLAMIRRLTEAARELQPDVFVPIDFPDFNFKLMAGVHALGVPVAYYISPQLWAWRPGRMKTMQRHVDRVLVIFPFEEAIYRDAGVPVTFVGHPLIEMLPAAPLAVAPWRQSLGLDPAAPTVALLPGSRRSELAHILPTLVEALPLIAARVPGVRFVVACAPNLPRDLFEPLASHPVKPVLVHGHTDEVLAGTDVAITASGTATVQCALHRRPMVVVYRLSSLTYRVGRRFALVDTYAMPNLIAGRRIVPELIQDGFTAARVADETVPLLTDPARHSEMRAGLDEVAARLGGPGATRRAAAAILDVARTAREHARAGAARGAGEGR